MMRQSERFAISPSLALQYEFEVAQKKTGIRKVFCSVRYEHVGRQGTMHYRNISEKDLIDNNYYIDFWDYRIGICFVDRKCDPDEKKDFFTKSIDSFTGVL
jgi:hypothetical protein